MGKGGGSGFPLSLCIQSSWDGAHQHAWQAKGCPDESLDTSQAWAHSHIHHLEEHTCHVFLSPQPNYKHVWHEYRYNTC